MPRKRGMDVRHRQGYFLGPKRAKARGLGGMRFWLTSISDVHFARCSCCIQSAIVHHVAQVRDGPIAVCISALIGAHRLYFALHHGRHRRPHKKMEDVGQDEAYDERPFLDLKPAEPLQGLEMGSVLSAVCVLRADCCLCCRCLCTVTGTDCVVLFLRFDC